MGARILVVGLMVVITALAGATTASARKRPNLKVTELTNPPASASSGGQINGEDTTTNTGRRKAKASITKYFLSGNTTFEDDDLALTGGHLVPKLLKKSSSHQSTNVGIPSDTADGSYYLIACADATFLVKEKKENENCRTSTTQVVVSAPSDIDSDGVPDSSDNCPAFANPGQEDNDADGKGNACDVCPNDSNPGNLPCPPRKAETSLTQRGGEAVEEALVLLAQAV